MVLTPRPAAGEPWEPKPTATVGWWGADGLFCPPESTRATRENLTTPWQSPEGYSLVHSSTATPSNPEWKQNESARHLSLINGMMANCKLILNWKSCRGRAERNYLRIWRLRFQSTLNVATTWQRQPTRRWIRRIRTRSGKKEVWNVLQILNGLVHFQHLRNGEEDPPPHSQLKGAWNLFFNLTIDANCCCTRFAIINIWRLSFIWNILESIITSPHNQKGLINLVACCVRLWSDTLIWQPSVNNVFLCWMPMMMVNNQPHCTE